MRQVIDRADAKRRRSVACCRLPPTPHARATRARISSDNDLENGYSFGKDFVLKARLWLCEDFPGAVHCTRADQNPDYVTRAHGGTPISPADIPLTSDANALRELAQRSNANRSPNTRPRTLK